MNVNLRRYIDLMTQYVGYATVSQPGQENPEAIAGCVVFLEQLFVKAGMNTQIWLSEKLNPILFAEYIKDAALPTVLVYGHYDEVAADPKEWTKTQPFELVEDNAILYGRGTTDNKGQNMIHIVSVLELIESGQLACNVKFFLEGNEETGSEGIESIIEEHKEDLRADYAMVSDGEMVSTTPVIQLSLRGLVNIKVTVTTSTKELHSGLAGGAVYNSTVEASKLIASLFDNKGDVDILGFYEGMPEELLASDALASNNRMLEEKVDFKQLFGVQALKADIADSEMRNTFTRIGLFPTIEVMGIISGNAQLGFRHIIPPVTIFGLNVRLVGTQDPHEMATLIREHLQREADDCVTLKFEEYAHHDPINIALGDEITDHITGLLEKAYAEKPARQYCGGGIPMVGHFMNILRVQPLVIPLANDTCNMHGSDENIGLSFVGKGLKFSTLFFSTPLPR